MWLAPEFVAKLGEIDEVAKGIKKNENGALMKTTHGGTGFVKGKYLKVVSSSFFAKC